MRPLVRAARPDELVRAGEVVRAAYAASSPVHGDYLDELSDAPGRAVDAEVLVAVDGSGTVMGSVTWCPAGSRWREVSSDGEGEMRMLGVDPTAHRSGVGTALVQACLERDAAAGFTATVLSTLSTATPAHRLYEGLGFVREKARDWYPVPGLLLVVYRYVA